MKNDKYLKVAKLFGFKSPLVDKSTFIGRKREVNKLIASLAGSQVTSAWIWGARKIGKTSLSYRIGEDENIEIIRISCDNYKWDNIETFIETIAKEAISQLKIELKKERLERLTELAMKGKKNHHIIIILDEFDQIAVNLRQFEQAFLRATLQNNPFFGFVFISRVKPNELLQDYSDENSRLIGVCDVIRVPMLNKDEVADLIEILENRLEEKLDKWFLNWVYEKVGGYPVCIQNILSEFCVLGHNLGSIPSKQQINDEEHIFFQSIENELKGLWKDLPLFMRNKLLRSHDKITHAEKRDFMAFNMFEDDAPISPIWLTEIGKESGLLIQGVNLPELFEITERLNDALKMCNNISLKMGGTQIFQTTQQFFHLFELTRPVVNETYLNERINILHKICIESTNSDKLTKEDRCLIPKSIRPIYKKSDGFQILIAWRNFCFHDPSRDLQPSEKSERYRNIGQICCKYLGPNCHTPESKDDYNRIYRGILLDVTNSVDQLRVALYEENWLT